jgi:hypothetical protein
METKLEGMKLDTGKLQYSLIPTSATRALAEVLTYSANKYAPSRNEQADTLLKLTQVRSNLLDNN